MLIDWLPFNITLTVFQL